MKIDVVPLPRMLTDEHVRGRVVVVFDVLRATTTIAAAVAAGTKEIRVFDSLESAQSAASEFSGQKLLCGERHCLQPTGFDLGNSPGSYITNVVAGKTLFLATTNGTRALVAARRANHLLTGALVNARAVADALAKLHHDVTLLCAGTDGERAYEDELGACAVISGMSDKADIELSDEVRASVDSWQKLGDEQIITFLRGTAGGKNVERAGLTEDIFFAARRKVFDVVPRCDGRTLTIRPMQI